MGRRKFPADRVTGIGCSDFRAAQGLSRREVLRLGGLTGMALTLPELLRARTLAEERRETASGVESRAVPARSPDKTFGAAKQVILLYLHGGHPQQETFDPKPEGPAELRGEFGAIDTSLPGVQFSEMLPRCAQIAHKLAVVRSMSHDNANHVSASLPAQSGHKHTPDKLGQGDFPPSATDFPPVGAVLSAVRPGTGRLPPWVRIGPLMRRNNGTVLHGQLPGLLGDKFASFVVDQSLLEENVRIDAVQPNPDLSSIRLTARRDLLREFDDRRKLLDQSTTARTLDEFYDRAFNLLAAQTTRQAFQLAQESPETRSRYGRTEFGQRCLLARRLAEAGVPMVNVSYCHTPVGSWDTHSQNFKQMKESLSPTFDTAFTALVNDLDERGRLDDTLVIATAEFGRTPQINKSAGRDHWPWVYSIAVAGAGVRAGTIYGASDTAAAYPTHSPHDPADFVATLYHLLGIPADITIRDNTSRPHHVILGKPIAGILG